MLLQKLSRLDVYNLQSLTYQLQKCFSFWRLLPQTACRGLAPGPH